MTKKEVAKELRKLLTQELRGLPNDIEYKHVSAAFDTYDPSEESGIDHGKEHGKLYVIELSVEEKQNEY